LKGEDQRRGGKGWGLLACFLIFGVAAPLALAQTPPIPEPDPAPAPATTPPAPSSSAPAPVVSVQTPAPPVVRERPRKPNRTRKPAPEPTFLAPIHSPDPGPALVSVLKEPANVAPKVPAPISPIPAAGPSQDPLPVMPVLAILAALGVLLTSLAAAPRWALARISSSLARQQMDVAFIGFVLLAGLAAAFLVSAA
jgi:hypothetical protein